VKRTSKIPEKNYYLTQKQGDWYVVSNDALLCVKDCEEGRKVISELQAIEKLKKCAKL
tara:strand:+ start:353 stop:526 length:174 start_codon:yes stop_codon:yes gene_type:complete